MFSVKIAEHDFRIYNRHSYIERLCRDYIEQDSTNAFEITVSDNEIEREKIPGEFHPEPYLESTAVYRKMCEHLIEDGLFLFHSSAVSTDGHAILFAAPSGTGKSTHAKLWRQVFGDRVTIINDDKPLIKIIDSCADKSSEAIVFGTPWSGKHDLQHNVCAPVRAVVLIEQSQTNSIEEISARDAYPMVLNQTYRPNNARLMAETLSLVSSFTKAVKFYKLKCNISEDAVHTVYNELYPLISDK